MAEELLERVRREIRERKLVVRDAYEESLRLEQALGALECDAQRTRSPRPRTSSA
jgi:hypothetical protein